MLLHCWFSINNRIWPGQNEGCGAFRRETPQDAGRINNGTIADFNPLHLYFVPPLGVTPFESYQRSLASLNYSPQAINLHSSVIPCLAVLVE